MNVKKELKKCIAMFSILTVAIPLVGCAVRREAGGSFELEPDESQIEETLYTYRVEQGSVNPNPIIELLLDCSPEEAEEKYRNNDYKMYETNDGRKLSLSSYNKMYEASAAGDNRVTFIYYEDENEGAMSCYSLVALSEIRFNLANGIMRAAFPEENLGHYPKEKAIEMCRPYAEACGYKDAEVSVYALTLDIIEKNAQIDVNVDGISDGFSSAPGPGYEAVTRKRIAELKAEGKQEEAEQLEEYKRHGATDREIPWEKKHEAYILTYQPYLEGYEMAEDLDYLVMLYVPIYERPIYIQGRTPYTVVETLESVSIISKEEALGEVLLMKGYESADEMDDVQITFLYALQANAESKEIVEMAIPCWKVDYVRDQKHYTVMIDAVHGDGYKRAPTY